MNLFRKIRRALLAQNRFTRYLLYALGEIVLVVVGILIALSINTWNENRKNTNEARFHLLKLKDNLNSDKNQIISSISRNEDYAKDLIFCAKVLSGDTSISKNEFLNSFQHMSATNSFAPTRGTFEGLISSGKIQLITSQSLLDDLLLYYNASSYVAWDKAVEDYTRNVFSPYLLSFDHISNITDEREGNSFTQFDLSEFSVPGKSIEDYGKDQFILNALRFKIQLFEGQKMQYESLRIEIDALIDLIEKELNH